MYTHIMCIALSLSLYIYIYIYIYYIYIHIYIYTYIFPTSTSWHVHNTELFHDCILLGLPFKPDKFDYAVTLGTFAFDRSPVKEFPGLLLTGRKCTHTRGGSSGSCFSCIIYYMLYMFSLSLYIYIYRERER